MSDNDDILGTNLAARVSRLPRDFEPPTDLWPAIAAGIARAPADLESLTRRLERDVEPDVDLWPAIEAKLREPSPVAAPGYRWRIPSWLNAAASLAAVAIIAGLASFTFVTSEQTDSYATGRTDGLWWLMGTAGMTMPPAGTLLGETIAAVRAELDAVQNERMKIEQSLSQDAENLALHGLWLKVYQTELELAGTAEQLIERYQGA
jgi:hypothetical protein